jgi:hypothetical protein
MKRAIMLSFYLLFFANAFAQGPHVCSTYGGVYFTEEAFLNRKYDDSICTDFWVNNIRVGNFQKVILTENEVEKIYKQNKVYAYTYKGRDYRYQKADKLLGERGYFAVKDTSGLVIYTQRSGGTYNSVVNYYYSVGKTSKIKLLTVKNLEQDFPGTPFVESCQDIVKRLTSQSEDSALSSLMEINNLFRKHLG